MEIQKSSEDYLETMLMMQKKYGYIRSIDVAEHLGVTKPSVSYATKRLRESGYSTMDKTGLITPKKSFTATTPSPISLSAWGWIRRRRRPMPARSSMTSAHRPLRPSAATPGSTRDKKQKMQPRGFAPRLHSY